jgi:hypothetical protein
MFTTDGPMDPSRTSKSWSLPPTLSLALLSAIQKTPYLLPLHCRATGLGCKTQMRRPDCAGGMVASCLAHLPHCRKQQRITLWSKTYMLRFAYVPAHCSNMRRNNGQCCVRQPDRQSGPGIRPGRAQSARHKCQGKCPGRSAQRAVAGRLCRVSGPCLPHRL